MRANITRLATTWTGDKDFRKVFHQLDEDEKGSLSRKKFKEGLEDLGFELTNREFERYWIDLIRMAMRSVIQRICIVLDKRCDAFEPVSRLKTVA